MWTICNLIHRIQLLKCIYQILFHPIRFLRAEIIWSSSKNLKLKKFNDRANDPNKINLFFN